MHKDVFVQVDMFPDANEIPQRLHCADQLGLVDWFVRKLRLLCAQIKRKRCGSVRSTSEELMAREWRDGEGHRGRGENSGRTPEGKRVQPERLRVLDAIDQHDVPRGLRDMVPEDRTGELRLPVKNRFHHTTMLLVRIARLFPVHDRKTPIAFRLIE